MNQGLDSYLEQQNEKRRKYRNYNCVHPDRISAFPDRIYYLIQHKFNVKTYYNRCDDPCNYFYVVFVGEFTHQ
jgi:hypothetical protein